MAEALGYSYLGAYPRPAKEKGPDFVIQKQGAAGEQACLEAKGSFVRPEKNARVKEALSDGLDQVSHAQVRGFAKGFVIGSFLRESRDTLDEPSMIAIVETAAVGHQASSHQGKGNLLRQNYAAWLSAMGFPEEAEILRGHPAISSRDRKPLIRLELGGKVFGGRPISPLALPVRERPPSEPQDGLTLVLGLDQRVMEGLDSMLHGEHRESAGGFPEIESDMEDRRDRGEGEFTSRMQDGTVLALVPTHRLLEERGELLL